MIRRRGKGPQDPAVNGASTRVVRAGDAAEQKFPESAASGTPIAPRLAPNL